MHLILHSLCWLETETSIVICPIVGMHQDFPNRPTPGTILPILSSWHSPDAAAVVWAEYCDEYHSSSVRHKAHTL